MELNVNDPQSEPRSLGSGTPRYTQTIEITSIIVPQGRQRKNPRDAKPLLELKRSIASKGLLHPPVLATATGDAGEALHLQLVAGERRLIAITELHQDGVPVYCNGTLIPAGHCPFTRIGDLSPADLEEAELEENLMRLILPWPEAAAAKLRIFELRKAQNPDQTLLATAQELASKAEPETTTETKEYNELRRAQLVAPFMALPAVGKAKSLDKAYRAVLDIKKTQLNSTLKKLSVKVTNHRIIHGDFLEVSPTLDKGYFDFIYADPPYGISANKQSFERKHEYDDSPEVALRFYQELLRRGFHLLKPQGHIFLFCDIEHFFTIRTFAEQQLFSTWRTPIIWQKGTEGPAPWGRNGFARTYEIGLFAAKGQRPLQYGPEPDIKLVPRVNRQDRRHAAEKPPEFIRWLLQLTTTPGCKVLDPCTGSASILPAAKDLGLELTLVEKSKDYYEQALARAQELDDEPTPEADIAREPLTVEALDDAIFGKE